MKEAAAKGYRINESGDPVSPSGEVLAKNQDRTGYWRFTVLSSDGKRRNVYIHRLVAFTKFGESLFEKGIEVRHKNGNESDNSCSNILIGTKSENELDKAPEVRAAFVAGAEKAARKLSDGQVAQLRADRAAGAKYDELALKYGIRKSTVSYIVRGITCT